MPKRCSIVATTCLSPSQATDMGPCRRSDRVPCWMTRIVARLLERRMIKNEWYDRKTSQCNSVRSWNVSVYMYVYVYIYICIYIIYVFIYVPTLCFLTRIWYRKDETSIRRA